MFLFGIVFFSTIGCKYDKVSIYLITMSFKSTEFGLSCSCQEQLFHMSDFNPLLNSGSGQYFATKVAQ